MNASESHKHEHRNDIPRGSKVRGDMLVKRVRSLLQSRATQAIKDLSLQVGYKSPRSFARAISRALRVLAKRTAFSGNASPSLRPTLLLETSPTHNPSIVPPTYATCPCCSPTPRALLPGATLPTIAPLRKTSSKTLK